MVVSTIAYFGAIEIYRYKPSVNRAWIDVRDV